MNSDIFWGTKIIFNPKINGQEKNCKIEIYMMYYIIIVVGS